MGWHGVATSARCLNWRPQRSQRAIRGAGTAKLRRWAGAGVTLRASPLGGARVSLPDDSRTAYEDAPEPGHDRLLLRLWLAPPNSRPLPEGFETLWGSIKGGAVRGGIAQF
jgi:hypothetical protein